MDELSKRRLEKALAKPSEKLTNMIKTQDNINRLLDEIYEHLTGESWACPSFMESKYLYFDRNGNPQLKEEAPQELKDEFKEFIEAHEDPSCC